MASIPNLKTLRTGRGGPRRRQGGRQAFSSNNEATEADVQAAQDTVIRQTDSDASSSRTSAVSLGYLHDQFAKDFHTPGAQVPKRYPIINRGTFVRTTAIDRLVKLFLASEPTRKKQLVSLGAGSDTRFFRFYDASIFTTTPVEYHELDFESNVNTKRATIRNSPRLSGLLQEAEKSGASYHLHALDLRDLTAKSPPAIPKLDSELPTLILSECCLCYLPPDAASSVLQYFTMNINAPLGLILYEPIRPFDAFGKTMVSNLASRGIHLQTLKRYSTLEAQRQRLRLAGLESGQGARDVHQLWSSDWIGEAERDRVEKLEWLDEVEEWQLLASHYCVAWGWGGGDVFTGAWEDLEGRRTTVEEKEDAPG